VWTRTTKLSLTSWLTSKKMLLEKAAHQQKDFRYPPYGFDNLRDCTATTSVSANVLRIEQPLLIVSSGCSPLGYDPELQCLHFRINNPFSANEIGFGSSHGKSFFCFKLIDRMLNPIKSDLDFRPANKSPPKKARCDSGTLPCGQNCP